MVSDAQDDAREDGALAERDASAQFRVLSSSVFPKRPSYFVRPFWSSRWVPYTSGFANHIWLPGTAKTATQLRGIPQLVDPVPTPDDRFVTIPINYLPPGFTSLVFYAVNHETGELTEAFRDGKMAGAYQSVGMLSDSLTEVRYRVVTEATLLKGRLRVQDYVVTKPDAAQGTGYKFARVHPRKLKLCPGEDLSLPMMSKDGRHFAAVDASTRVMHVYDIDLAGNCSGGRSLGFISGKVDFSRDGRKLLFHRSLPDATSVAKVVKHPDRDWQLDIFEYDFDSTELTRLTHCGDGPTPANCYYPNHMSDGRIGYIRQEKNDTSYSWVIMSKSGS